LVSAKMTKHSKNQLAKSAFEIINDLMGDIHGARITGIFAIKKPDIFMTKHPKYIIRNSISIIVLSLRKFDDLWKHQIKNLLLKNEPSEGIELEDEIATKKIRKFCNIVVAHYADEKTAPKTTEKKIKELLDQQGFKSDEDFFLWTKELLSKIESVRNSLQSEYAL
jgi:hypothetical protein